jgi:dihydroxyacetone kinase-like predicted kinase
VDIDRFTRDSVLEFGYCTEVLLRLTTSKVDPDHFALQTVLDALQELGGESVVAFQQEDIVKVHVHTFTPGKILDRLQCYGEFLTLKIENMSLGHSGEQEEKPKAKQPFAVVTVATGEGLTEKFRALGAQAVISGGQTANPSIAEFVEAFKTCCAEHIIVLPNNKNIILAAQQAANVYTDAKVHIVETKNLMQGISAMSVITPGLTDMEVLLASAQRAAMGVEGYEVTKAVRDATVGGKTVC